MMDAARSGSRHAVAPPPLLSTPLVDRVRGFFTVYRDNLRLAEENERLLGWQQVALKLSARKRAIARPAESGARTGNFLCHGAGDRQFGRRLCPQRHGQCRPRQRRSARSGGD